MNSKKIKNTDREIMVRGVIHEDWFELCLCGAGKARMSNGRHYTSCSAARRAASRLAKQFGLKIVEMEIVWEWDK